MTTKAVNEKQLGESAFRILNVIQGDDQEVSIASLMIAVHMVCDRVGADVPAEMNKARNTINAGIANKSTHICALKLYCDNELKRRQGAR